MKRCYNQYCGLAKAMDIIGERWTLLILRDLLLGPWRYSDLLERMEGMTTNLLASRLKEMEENGLIKKTQLSSIGSPHVYELTELGKKLEPAMLALSQFGFNFMQNGPEKNDKVDAGRALLNLKGRYQGKLQGIVTLQISMDNKKQNTQAYQIIYSPEYVDVRYGKQEKSETEVWLSLRTYADMFFRGENAKDLENAGKISIEGKRKDWGDFLRSFGM